MTIFRESQNFYLPCLCVCVFATVLACVVFVLFLCLNILVGDNLLFVSV